MRKPEKPLPTFWQVERKPTITHQTYFPLPFPYSNFLWMILHLLTMLYGEWGLVHLQGCLLLF